MSFTLLLWFICTLYTKTQIILLRINVVIYTFDGTDECEDTAYDKDLEERLPIPFSSELVDFP